MRFTRSPSRRKISSIVSGRTIETTSDAEPYEVVYVSDQLRPSAVVCVPTMRRPEHLKLTLASLAAQDFEQPFACLVADNDALNRQGAALAESLLRDGKIAGAVVVVPRPGNCSACNSAFSAARALFPDAPLVTMIDDDEIAEVDWLRRLVEAQERTGADLVGGPVLPHFEQSRPAGLLDHPVFKPYYHKSGFVPFLYGSGNVLLRAAVLDRIGKPYFDDAFNFVGGGDLDFFKRCSRAGFTAFFENAARATETVPIERTSTSWVINRSLRYGAINYMVERKQATSVQAHLRIILKSLVLLGLGPARTLGRLLTYGTLLAAAHPLLEAVGRAAAHFGLRPEQYRLFREEPS